MVVTVVEQEGLLASGRQVEARDAAENLCTTHSTTPRQRTFYPKASVVPRLRNPI